MRRTPIEDLRSMVRYFNHMNETFNQGFTMDELIKIWTFAESNQGSLVHECADCWPVYLLDAILAAERGARVPTALIEAA